MYLVELNLYGSYCDSLVKAASCLRWRAAQTDPISHCLFPIIVLATVGNLPAIFIVLSCLFPSLLGNPSAV